MSAERPVIHIVDDDDLVRTALANLLGAAGYEVRAYASAAEFLSAPPRKRPGCILLDVMMPGLTGLELQEALVKRGEAIPVIFLSAHGDIPMSVTAMKAGAVDFLTKPVDGLRLIKTVREALARDAETREAGDELEATRRRCGTLTERELEVYKRVAAGLLNKQIAAELGISERTVKAHRARVVEKMQAKSLAELAHMATLLQFPSKR